MSAVTGSHHPDHQSTVDNGAVNGGENTGRPLSIHRITGGGLTGTWAGERSWYLGGVWIGSWPGGKNPTSQYINHILVLAMEDSINLFDALTCNPKRKFSSPIETTGISCASSAQTQHIKTYL
ncbi:hypothetical protein Tco_0400443 [Tanacetum coccineum]